MVWLKSNWFKIAFLLVLVVSLCVGFYWFGFRDEGIEAGCHEYSVNQLGQGGDISARKTWYDRYFQECLEYGGVEKMKEVKGLQ